MNNGIVIAAGVVIVLVVLVIWAAGRSRGRESGVTERPAAPLPEPRPVPITPPKVREAAPAPDDDRDLIKWAAQEQKKEAASRNIPSIFQEAFRNIRTWTTSSSLVPGVDRPAILSAVELVAEDPKTYRFTLKGRAYSIVKTDLSEPGSPSFPRCERVQLVDAPGTTLLDIELITSNYDAEETPGEISTFLDGEWIADMKELNAFSSREGLRVGDDFRKKLRAREAERVRKELEGESG